MTIAFSQAIGVYSGTSQAITVNSDVNVAVIALTVYHGTNASLPTSVTVGGYTFSIAVSYTAQARAKVRVYYLANPPIGSQTVVITGGLYALLGWGFYGLSGGDTAAPVYAIGNDGGSSTVYTNFNLSLGGENRAVVNAFAKDSSLDYTGVGEGTILWQQTRSASSYGIGSGNYSVHSLQESLSQMASCGAAFKGGIVQAGLNFKIVGAMGV